MKTGGAPQDRGTGGSGNDGRLLSVLLARWQARAAFHEALEDAARNALAGDDPDEVSGLIEQQLTTEQTEYIAEFLFALRRAGCAEPPKLGAYIDRHNAMVETLLEALAAERRGEAPLGAGQKRRLWRLRSARFNDRIRASALERLGDGRLLLSLKDLERFMAPHMDPTLCRDRLDALVQVGLLGDEARPNIRLFWPLDRLEAIVAGQLSVFLEGLGDE
ncbi:MAG: hypothetical protein KDG89_14660 [Geminicoccaceae bacterium]|nr:hypothetical protein [Geminicoccaceae bacterium]